MNKPKLSSSVPATTKALQAWQSELRRLERRLEKWANDLAEREEVIEHQEAAFAEAVNEADGETLQLYANNMGDEDCGCTPEDAEDGCECQKCEQLRSSSTPPPTMDRRPRPGDKGDEVQWLENLWKLEDKRRKKTPKL